MQIGKTFGNELAAQGLGDGLSWDEETGEIFGRENLNVADKAKLDDVIAAHDPNTGKSDAMVDAEMDAATGVPEMLSVLEAIAARLPGPVSVDEIRADARARGRINLPRN